MRADSKQESSMFNSITDILHNIDNNSVFPNPSPLISMNKSSFISKDLAGYTTSQDVIQTSCCEQIKMFTYLTPMVLS